jgi:hypothetical protein
VTCTGAIRSGRLTSIRDVASNVSRKERSFADGAVGELDPKAKFPSCVRATAIDATQSLQELAGRAPQGEILNR